MRVAIILRNNGTMSARWGEEISVVCSWGGQVSCEDCCVDMCEGGSVCFGESVV